MYRAIPTGPGLDGQVAVLDFQPVGQAGYWSWRAHTSIQSSSVMVRPDERMPASSVNYSSRAGPGANRMSIRAGAPLSSEKAWIPRPAGRGRDDHPARRVHPGIDFPNSIQRLMPRRPLIRSVLTMNTVFMDNPSSGLRVSDADRDRAIAELSEHFQAGRLTTEELEDRTGRALQARTAGELAELFTDLPRQPAAVAGTGPAPAQAGSFRPARPARVPAVPIAIVALIVLGGLLSGHSALIALVPVLVFLTIRRLAGLRSGRR